MINPFKFIIDRRVPPLPGEKFYPTSKDGVTCAGWSWKPKGQALGTLFYTHGYCYHSRDEAGKKLAEKFDLAFVSFDFRNHGWSHNRHPSFGTAESWDLRGAMNLAEKMGFPRPFIVMGHSLGAMAAQRAAVKDERIAACFLASAPANPWHAIREAPKYMFPPHLKWLAPVASSLGNLINSHYGWDILTDGDVVRHQGAKNPPHRPLMYFVMGDQDHFGIAETRKVYDHWYQDVPGLEGKSEYAHEDPLARKWFVEMPNTKHLDIWLQPKWKKYQESFLRRCLMGIDSPTEISQGEAQPTQSLQPTGTEPSEPVYYDGIAKKLRPYSEKPKSFESFQFGRIATGYHKEKWGIFKFFDDFSVLHDLKFGTGSASSSAFGEDSIPRIDPIYKGEPVPTPTLYCDIGGASIRTFHSAGMDARQMLTSFTTGESTASITSRHWDPFANARHLPLLIGKQAGLHPRPDRVAMSVFGGVSADGRSFEGFWQTQGVPANLAECVENALDLPRGSVRLRNDAEAWALGSRALLQHLGKWSGRHVGVLVIGTGVGFAVVSETHVLGYDLGVESFQQLGRHSRHGANIHDYLGKPYHQWLSGQGWSPQQQASDAALRVRMALDDLKAKYQLSDFIIGGGMTEVLDEADFTGHALILSRENLGFDPGLVPIVGLNS